VVNQRNTYDRLLNGVVDLAYAPFGAVTDTMPRQEVTALPFESPGLDQSALAAWEITNRRRSASKWNRVARAPSWTSSPPAVR